jgi:hypothetical protein
VGVSGRTRPIKASAFRVTTRETSLKKSSLKYDIGTQSYNHSGLMSCSTLRGLFPEGQRFRLSTHPEVVGSEGLHPVYIREETSTQGVCEPARRALLSALVARVNRWATSVELGIRLSSCLTGRCGYFRLLSAPTTAKGVSDFSIFQCFDLRARSRELLSRLVQTRESLTSR